MFFSTKKKTSFCHSQDDQTDQSLPGEPAASKGKKKKKASSVVPCFPFVAKIWSGFDQTLTIATSTLQPHFTGNNPCLRLALSSSWSWHGALGLLRAAAPCFHHNFSHTALPLQKIHWKVNTCWKCFLIEFPMEFGKGESLSKHFVLLDPVFLHYQWIQFWSKHNFWYWCMKRGH